MTELRIVLRGGSGGIVVSLDQPVKGSFRRSKPLREREEAMVYARLLRLEVGGVIVDETGR